MAKITSTKAKSRWILSLLVVGTFLIAGVIAIASYYASGKYSGQKGRVSGPKPGVLAPRFSVISASGNKILFPIESNKDTVLFFTTLNPCSSCLHQANELVNIQSKYFANTTVIGIGIGPSVTASSLNYFANRIHNLNYKFYLQNSNVSTLYNVKANNTIVVINRSRKVIFSGKSPSTPTLEEAVGEALLES